LLELETIADLSEIEHSVICIGQLRREEQKCASTKLFVFNDL